MDPKPIASAETRQQAAASISVALDFLRGEAEAAGLLQVADRIRRASVTAKEQAELRAAVDLPEACEAIGRLPDEYRSALVYKKVYQRSYEQIASDCGISLTMAKHRVARGFQLVRASLQAKPDR